MHDLRGKKNHLRMPPDALFTWPCLQHSQTISSLPTLRQRSVQEAGSCRALHGFRRRRRTGLGVRVRRLNIPIHPPSEGGMCCSLDSKDGPLREMNILVMLGSWRKMVVAESRNVPPCPSSAWQRKSGPKHSFGALSPTSHILTSFRCTENRTDYVGASNCFQTLLRRWLTSEEVVEREILMEGLSASRQGKPARP